jgi:hypothetical protein
MRALVDPPVPAATTRVVENAREDDDDGDDDDDVSCSLLCPRPPSGCADVTPTMSVEWIRSL